MFFNIFLELNFTQNRSLDSLLLLLLNGWNRFLLPIKVFQKDTIHFEFKLGHLSFRLRSLCHFKTRTNDVTPNQMLVCALVFAPPLCCSLSSVLTSIVIFSLLKFTKLTRTNKANALLQIWQNVIVLDSFCKFFGYFIFKHLFLTFRSL